MPGPQSALVLIGFSGSGKSSVGRELAARTQLPRYDTDEMVRTHFGLTIAEIFGRYGEDLFRDVETKALGEIPRTPAIVVTGGGVVLRAQNAAMLRRLGTIVHLTAEEETLFARVSRRSTRPLLKTENPRQTLSDLLRVREPLYRALADVEVDTTSRTHEEVAAAVLERTAMFDERIRSQTRTR